MEVVAGDYLYARGYLYAEKPASPPHRFLCLGLPNGAFLYHAPEVDVLLADGGDTGRWVCLIGSPVDLSAGHMDLRAIGANLLAGLTVSETEFWDRLDFLGGRWVALYSDGKRVRALHDACGQKTIFYSPHAPAISSHARLLRDHVGDLGLSEVYEKCDTRFFKFGLPGLETPYRGIRILTPNTLIDLGDCTVRRYFPRDNLPSQELAVATDKAAKLMRRHVGAIPAGRRVLASLTGGMDSRTTLAILRHRENAEFFTYCGDPLFETDTKVASKIAAILGLRHHVIDAAILPHEWESYNPFSEVLSANACYVHLHKPAYRYVTCFGGSNALNISSRLAEIGRAFYHTKTGADFRYSPENHLALYAPNLVGNHHALKAFTDFCEISQIENCFNYDIRDLMYWECRMGTWAAFASMEADPAFDTHHLFNSRCVLKAVLSIDYTERARSSAFRSIISSGLPELDDVKIYSTWR